MTRVEIYNCAAFVRLGRYQIRPPPGVEAYPLQGQPIQQT